MLSYCQHFFWQWIMKEKTALIIIYCFLAQCAFMGAVFAESNSSQMLAKQYHDDIEIEKYWVSEKLDGIRARWDGYQLISKNGYAFSVPEWFTRRFPRVVMDGELWIGRNRYEEISSITSKQTPDKRWSRVTLMLFDLPEHKGDFSERLRAMQQLVISADSTYLAVIKQLRMNSNSELMAHLQTLIDAGGEGLMLHHQASLYTNGRSENLLKLKPFEDAEATVIAYKPGKGKFKGLLGSIKVRNDQGKEFYIGSGFNMQQRQKPPALLSRVTYKHNGLTKNGVPRFPVFLRVRNEK